MNAVPLPHSVVGKVYKSDSSNEASGIPVFINLTKTNNTYLTETFGPGPSPNNYAEEVVGEDGETIVVRAWNATHYGENSTSLENAPGTTYCNIIINTSRDPEANVTIISPLSNTTFNSGESFNITANVTMMGNDSRGCYAILNISNSSAINITSSETLNHSLGDISLGDTRNTTWELSAELVGESNFTVRAVCDSDGMNLEGLHSLTIENISITAAAPTIYLESPSNNSKVYNRNVTFYYNVTSDNTIMNCSLILNGEINQTNKSIQEGVSQNFSIYHLDYAQYNWSVNCTDSTGLVGSTGTFNISIEQAPDLEIISDGISFSETSPQENQNITIIANVSNIGGVNVENVIVQFFSGNYTLNNQIGNRTINISAGGYNITNVTYKVPAGTTDVYVVVDPPIESNGQIEESNENNNYAYNSVSVLASHIFVGNLSGALILGDSEGDSIIRWSVANTSESMIYVADYDSNINFNSLAAFGRNLSNSTNITDFEELDDLLDLENFTDSLNNSFTESGNVIGEYNFTIFGDILYHVPIINSTNNTVFFTGILWDSSDDTLNGGTPGTYDKTDSEDVVFITMAMDNVEGKYGSYDYEIKVPASLRDYVAGGDSSTVALYGEIH